jgi:hypothetical protein
MNTEPTLQINRDAPEWKRRQVDREAAKSMAVGSIGSSPSFFQQDQNYWSQAQAEDQATSADAALINVMGGAETNLAKGLASIANETALKRVNSQISALVQQVLSGNTGTSSGSSTGSSSTSSSSATPSITGAPATAIGTAPLTTSTPLANLGILTNGTISVGAGGHVTNYLSTGSDTVGDFIDAINQDLYGNANVTASLNSKGQLVITGKNDSDTITVEGEDAANIGFSVENSTFKPTAPSAPPASSASSASSTTASSSSGTSGSSSSTAAKNPDVVSSRVALTEQNLSTASGILSANGISGNLVDMLA